jgi:hypothetical protein
VTAVDVRVRGRPRWSALSQLMSAERTLDFVGKDNRPQVLPKNFDPERLIVELKPEKKSATGKTFTIQYLYNMKDGVQMKSYFEFQTPLMVCAYGAQQSDLSGPPTEQTPWSLPLFAKVVETNLPEDYDAKADVPQKDATTGKWVDRERTFEIASEPTGIAKVEEAAMDDAAVLEYVRFIAAFEKAALVKACELHGKKFTNVHRIVRPREKKPHVVSLALKAGQSKKDQNSETLITNPTVYTPHLETITFQEFIKQSSGAVLSCLACSPSMFVGKDNKLSIRFNTYKIICKKMGTDPSVKGPSGLPNVEDIPGSGAEFMHEVKRAKLETEQVSDFF